MRRRRNAKIIATLGPRTSDEKSINDLFLAGVDVFRLNFSHGAHAEHKLRLDTIRALEKKHNRPIGILLDLQGPKLRLGEFEEGKAILRAGNPFRLELTKIKGNDVGASLPHPEIFAALKPEMKLLLDDGKVELKVLRCGKDFAETVVVTGGELSDRKGVNVPSAMLDLSPITQKDHKDLQYGLELGVDWIALSFVQRPEDIIEAKKLVDGRAGVMAKLEKPSAIEYLDEIVDLADAVMVARGDLGVELPPEDVPAVQKQILYSCRCAGKPVVVATQMLESMIENSRPTRAEASDVANAVLDGADAVMLSGETSVGRFPLETVRTMARIICAVEGNSTAAPPLAHVPRTKRGVISYAARDIGERLNAKALVAFTSSGDTVRRLSRLHSPIPLLAFATAPEVRSQLALTWGTETFIVPDAGSTDDMIRQVDHAMLQLGRYQRGDLVVIVAGAPPGTVGSTNLIHVHRIGENDH